VSWPGAVKIRSDTVPNLGTSKRALNIVMLWVALSYRNDKGNSERTWEMMIQKKIQQVTSNLQEQQKDSRNIIIIL